MLQPPEEFFAAFINRTLPKIEWTHEAHLVACWMTLQTRTPVEAVDFLRDAIRSYNTSVGTANTRTGGYHETLTQFYVHAVAQARTDPGIQAAADLFAHDGCSREAPLRHWSRELLYSVAARARWVDPDLAPVPVSDPRLNR